MFGDLSSRIVRVARRYMATGMLSATPAAIVSRHFGGKPCFFVQIGANIGRDSLHRLTAANPLWRGILIEPQRQFFSALVANYGNDGRFIFENVAIADEPGDRPLFSAHEHGSVFGSLSRAHVEQHMERMKPATMTTETVRCETLPSVLARHRVASIDLLWIDAEGLDYDIIRQVDFARSPALIVYEHANLGHEAREAERFLSEHGYRVAHCNQLDAVAIRTR